MVRTREQEVFYLGFHEVLDDDETIKKLAGIFFSRIDELAEKVALKLDGRLKSLNSQLQDKEKRIVDLENEVCELKAKQDDQEQYSRRESLRLAGIAETQDENTDALVLSMVNEKMQVTPPVQLSEISRSHRTGKIEEGKTRQILVKFASYASRDRVIRSRKKLKGVSSPEGKPYMVTEDLTKERSFIAWKARILKRKTKVKDTWTWDGRIYITENSKNVVTITRRNQLLKYDPTILD